MSWRPKPSFLTGGRVAHFFVGAGLAVAMGWFGGYPGLGFSPLAAAVVGVAWELLTGRLADRFKWGHRFSDALDASAYPLGAIAVVAAHHLIR